MKTKKLAVIILTKNEEQNIADCIASASFADEILVIDSGSTDRTREIAEAKGARVVLHPFGEDGFAGQRNFALTQTQADWVFYLDADERLTPSCGQELRALMDGTPMPCRIRRVNVIFGKTMHHGAHRPDWTLRFFPRGSVHWEGVVHERAVSPLPMGDLSCTMEHHTYTSWAQYFHKFDQYTTMMAERMHGEGKICSLPAMLFHTAFAFFRAYVLRLGFLDGEYGLIFSLLHGFYTFVKYLKFRYRLEESA